MTKVLLINPPFNIAKANYDSSVSVGLLSIASYLKSRGQAVVLIDCVRERGYLDRLRSEAAAGGMAALSVMTMQIAEALRLSAFIREANPAVRIVWGGSHPTFFPRETAAHPLIDAVAVGEGEETLYELAAGRPRGEITGLAYKKEGRIIVTPPRPLLDPVKMPPLDWSLVPDEILDNLKLVPSLTSRGCPHRCTFCINAILKNRWRPRAPEQVLSDLEAIRDHPRLAGKSVRFWDENFFVDIRRARAIIEGMIARGLVFPWETTVRVDYLRPGMIDDGMLARLKRSGCYLLSFGAESGSERILKKIKKDVTPDEILASARACLRHGIIPQYSFMIGLPGEERSDMLATVRLIDRLVRLGDKVQVLGPQAFRPYPGSELYGECRAAGWQAPVGLEEWARVSENELSYLSVANFPWVADRDKDFVEAMEAYVRFGAHSLKSAFGSTVAARKILKLGFVLLCQLRWKMKFFAWPYDYKLAKRYVAG